MSQEHSVERRVPEEPAEHHSPERGPTVRGMARTARKKAGGFANFLSVNADVVTPSSGVMSAKERSVCLYALVDLCEDMGDIADADMAELETEVLRSVVVIGGAERSYVGERVLTLTVGARERSVEQRVLLTALKESGQTPRAFARGLTYQVTEMFEDPQLIRLFKQTYGPEADVRVLRADLLHKRYGHKYDQAKIDRVRSGNLREARGRPITIERTDDDEEY